MLERQRQQQQMKMQMQEQSRVEEISGGGGSACQQQQRNKNHANNPNNTPFRCKRMLKLALEGAREASNRFKRRNSTTLSNQRSCISLLGGEWVGSHALLAVCYRRLEDFQENQEQTTTQTQSQTQQGNNNNNNNTTNSNNDDRGPRSPVESLCSPRSCLEGIRFSSSMSFSSGSFSIATTKTTASIASIATQKTASSATNNKPRSERLVHRILQRLEKQHLFDPGENYNDGVTCNYYNDDATVRSNATTSSTVLAVWNQDVLGGRAGALQTIFWLRNEFGIGIESRDTNTNTNDMNTDTHANTNTALLGQDLAVSLAVKILDEGLATAVSMGLNHNRVDDNDDGHGNDDDGNDNNDDAILFWVCDSQGSHKAYLGAARGVVGIMHTLLGLSSEDWELVEEEIPNAQNYLRNTIDAFLPDRCPPLAGSSSDVGSDSRCVDTTDRASSNEPRPSALYHRFVYDGTPPTKPVSAPPQTSRSPALRCSARYPHPPPKTKVGNLRPALDASSERDTSVGWFHGATGLAMMLLEAAKVYRCKEYLQEAHRLCDAVIFPRGLRDQKIRTTTPTNGGNNRNQDFVHGGRNSYGGSHGSSTSTTGSTSTAIGSNGIHHKYIKKGPVGLAGMAVCFLQLSELCSNDKEEEKGGTDKNDATTKVSLPPNTSLKRLWKARAMLYAQHAHQEWTNYTAVIPTTTGVWNAFSLYEGMGGLVSLLWQLSLSAFPNADETMRTAIDPIVQLPLFSASYIKSHATNHDGTDDSLEPILLSSKDVTFLATTEKKIKTATTPTKSRRAQAAGLSPKQALAESRRRRAAAEAETQRRMKVAEEAYWKKAESAKAQRAVMNARRKAELESRKNAQLLARKKALEVAQQREEQQSKKDLESAEKKKEEDRIKREALLLARKQAKERVDARRKAKEEAEQAKAEEEAKLKAIDAENKRKAAEQEAKKRRALMEARLRRQAKEAEMATKQEEELKAKQAADRLRRAAELEQKEELRQKRHAELRRRQQKAAEVAKEEERKRIIRVVADRERRETELKRKEEKRRKQLDIDRRRRLEVLRQKHRKEEQTLAEQRQEREEVQRKALEAREKRRCELRKENMKKQRDLREQRLRDELQRALDKEVEKQQREEKIRVQAVEERKRKQLLEERYRKDIHASDEVEIAPPTQKFDYSPSFANKKNVNPAHFSAPSRTSLFWSLQTDSNIGSSESYKPALVPTESLHPSNGEGPATCYLSSLSSSPAPVHLSSVSIPSKDMQDSVLSSRTLSTAPLSTATEQVNALSMSRNHQEMMVSNTNN